MLPIKLNTVELVIEVKNHIPLLKQVLAEGANGKLNVSLFL